jgi:hypothetical protein
MRRNITIATTALFVLVAGSSVGASTQPETRTDLARARIATHQYHDPAAAVRDGFRPTNDCVALPDGSAGMGYHYVAPSRMDFTLVLEEPEALLYEPSGNGRKLVGIEYIVPDADQNLATDGDRPSLFGQPFDGPMPGHTPGQPIHYDLHVWIWEGNPDGMFALWNPNVSC